MTIGYHAPPPGARSGVADYAARLLEALQGLASFKLDAARADLHLYHLGNNRLHEAIYARALATPGVVVLHDAVLHHFLLGTLSREQYLTEWVYNYGAWRRHIGEELWRERASSAVDLPYFEYPMLRRVAETSRAIIVHNPGAAVMARAHGAKNVHVIPHFFEPVEVPDAADTARFRQRLGIPHGVTLFGIFGYLRETKRVLPSIHAFRKLHAAGMPAALLIAGEAVSPDLDRLLASEAGHPAIYRLPHLSESDFWLAAAAVDCCINLRYPGAGETSGIAIRLMGIGRPVILTESDENSGFPDTGCLRVPSGVGEAGALFENMALVATEGRLAREIGEHAAVHIKARHLLADVAREYWEVLQAQR